MACGKRYPTWCWLVGGVLVLLLRDSAMGQENKIVRGTLLAAEGNTLRVKQADGKETTVLVSPQTEYRVTAKGPARLLSAGAWVRVEGQIEMGGNTVRANGLSLVLTQNPRRPVKGLLQTGDKGVSLDLYGTIDSLNPLRVVADRGSGLLATQPGKSGVQTIDLGGQTLDIAFKGQEITLDFGDNLAMAGKDPQVQAHLYDQQAGTATSVWVTRVEPLDLNKLPAKKKGGKKR